MLELIALFKITPVLQALTVIGFSLGSIWGISKLEIEELKELSRFELPRSLAQSLVESLPANTPLLTESNWFLQRYLSSVENYRPDLALVYIPSLLYPDYFGAAEIVGLDASSISKEKFLSFASQLGPIAYEPNSSLNNFLANVVQCQESGAFLIKRAQTSQVTRECLDTKISNLKNLLHQIEGLPSIIKYDSNDALLRQAVALADLVAETGDANSAADILASICSVHEINADSQSCNSVLLNNLSVYYLRANKISEAIRVARAGIAKYKSNQTLKDNLVLALERLNNTSSERK